LPKYINRITEQRGGRVLPVRRILFCWFVKWLPGVWMQNWLGIWNLKTDCILSSNFLY